MISFVVWYSLHCVGLLMLAISIPTVLFQGLTGPISAQMELLLRTVIAIIATHIALLPLLKRKGFLSGPRLRSFVSLMRRWDYEVTLLTSLLFIVPTPIDSSNDVDVWISRAAFGVALSWSTFLQIIEPNQGDMLHFFSQQLFEHLGGLIIGHIRRRIPTSPEGSHR